MKNYFAELLPLKGRDQVKRSPNKHPQSVEITCCICATVIGSKGYDYENLNKEHCTLIPSTPLASKVNLLVIAIENFV